jgi:hypothetical protein
MIARDGIAATHLAAADRNPFLPLAVLFSTIDARYRAIPLLPRAQLQATEEDRSLAAGRPIQARGQLPVHGNPRRKRIGTLSVFLDGR